MAVWILLILISAILLYLVYPLLKRKQGIVPDTKHVPAYTIRYATKDDLSDIVKLQASAYSYEDAVPIELYKEWYAANPEGFFVLEISGVENEIVGHLTFLAIKDERLELLKKV